MATQRCVRTLGPALASSKCLWLRLVLLTTFAAICQLAYSQECVQCAVTADLQEPITTGEWLLTKQVTEVNVLFVAARKGKPVGDLSRDDISVRDDNKVPAAILGFRTEQSLPLRVGVVIDTSNSVTSRFRFEQAAASAFFQQTMNRNSDLGFVMGFENHPHVMQDFVADPDLLSQGVQRLKIGGGTALYDAVRVACQKLVHRTEEDMVARVLVILSDGQNNAGTATLESAVDAAQEAEVTIYTISTNYQSLFADSPDYEAEKGNANLRQMAEQTGGRLFRPRSPQEVTKSFAKIGDELRSRYSVSYKPADFVPDGRYRTIKIETNKNGEKLEIRARKGYYARAASSLSSDDTEEAQASVPH